MRLVNVLVGILFNLFVCKVDFLGLELFIF